MSNLSTIIGWIVAIIALSFMCLLWGGIYYGIDKLLKNHNYLQDVLKSMFIFIPITTSIKQNIIKIFSSDIEKVFIWIIIWSMITIFLVSISFIISLLVILIILFIYGLLKKKPHVFQWTIRHLTTIFKK